MDGHKSETTLPECCTFVPAKASEPQGCLLRPIKIIRTTHSDNPYGGKGMVGTTQRDDPDTSKRLSERPKGDHPFRAPKVFINFKIQTYVTKVH